MDMRNANHSSYVALSNIPYAWNASLDLWGDGCNLVIPDCGAARGGNLASPGKASGSRDRQALERLLESVIPTGAKKAARQLLERYGTLGAVFNAYEKPRDVNPVGTLLCATRAALLQSLRSEVYSAPIFSTTQTLIKYLSFSMSRLKIEEVRVLYLDTGNRLIRDETVCRGTINEAPIYPREILKIAIEFGATALILAHNHPSGDPSPSAADIDATERLIRAGKELGIVMHDHIIVASGGWLSLKSEGII
jgi:DNA repair protein RadC